MSVASSCVSVVLYTYMPYSDQVFEVGQC
jgi:hypothetical protein